MIRAVVIPAMPIGVRTFRITDTLQNEDACKLSYALILMKGVQPCHLSIIKVDTNSHFDYVYCDGVCVSLCKLLFAPQNKSSYFTPRIA